MMRRWLLPSLALILLGAGAWLFSDPTGKRHANRIIAAIADYRESHWRLPDPDSHEVMEELGFEWREGWHPAYQQTLEGGYRITILRGFDGPYWYYESIAGEWVYGFPPRDEYDNPGILDWVEFDRVFDDLGSVSERLLEVHQPVKLETQSIAFPESSSDPHTLLELTSWSIESTGITFITTKNIKSVHADEVGKTWLSHVRVDVAIYAEYRETNHQSLENFFVITAETARERYPNAMYGDVDAHGTGTIFQKLYEHGNDPDAYVFMDFEQGDLITMSFGKPSPASHEMMKRAVTAIE